MTEFVVKFLAIIGLVVLTVLASVMISIAVDSIKDMIGDLKWRYKIKHRFDKPPVAKCYCRDCIYFRRSNGVNRCCRGNIDNTWGMTDWYFCWEASPLKHDPEKEKETHNEMDI